MGLRHALVLTPLLTSFGVSAARAEPLPCRVDDRLTEAAATLLLQGEPLVASALLDASRAHGYDGVAVHARVASNEEEVTTWLAGLGDASQPLECGEARDERQRLVLAARRGGRLVLAGGSVHGELSPGFSAPRLVIENAAGELSELALSPAQLTAGFRLDADQPKPRRIQLVAEHRDGPRPVAELVFALRPAAASAPSAAKTRSPAELLALVQTQRRAAKVGAVRDNRLLTQSAQRHAERICELGKLAHRLEGEDPELRLRREHIGARGVGEALARAESADAAWRALLESPAHRMAVSRRDFTDVGVGQARDPKQQVCLVVLLASWPRRLP